MQDREGLSLSRARAVVLELCARLFLAELDPEARNALLTPEILDSLELLEPGVAAYLSGDWSEVDWEDAAAEYCSLFLMGGATAPVASAWIGDEPALAGAATGALVTGWSEQLGLKLAQGLWGQLPQDHLTVLVGLLAHALSLPGPLGEALAGDIIGRGLSPWVGSFSEAVLKKTANPLYRALVRLLLQCIGSQEDPQSLQV